MEMPENNDMSLRKLQSTFAERCPLEQEASNCPEQWLREHLTRNLFLEGFMRQERVIKYVYDFVSIWLCLIA